jgi:hypothetical protein
MAENTSLVVDDIKKELPPQDFQTFTLGDDSVADMCLARAAIWIRGKVLQTGKAYDETNEVIRECVLKRAVYELFSFVGMESRAKMKLRDLEDLMESYFGPVSSMNEESGASAGPSAGCIHQAERPRYGR